MQFDKEKAVKILTDELCYAYCDNCANSANIENCDNCHRKYQNWALRKYQNWALDKDTAAYIVDRIIKEC